MAKCKILVPIEIFFKILTIVVKDFLKGMESKKGGLFEKGA